MTDIKSLRIAFIGLGNAGYPLASCIAKAGYPLIVHDEDASRLKQFVSQHSQSSLLELDEVSEALNDVSVAITMLPNGEIVRDVLLRLAKDLKRECVIVDMSSSSPFHTRETAALLAKINPGVTLIDCPVTQSYAGAIRTGEATLMVGCSNPTALEIVMPILKCMGKHVFVMGALGAGHAMKTLNNFVSGASIIGLCDALMAGQKFGLEPEKMVDVMNVGTGVNFSTKESFRQDVSPIDSLGWCGHCGDSFAAIGPYSTLPIGISVVVAGEGHEDCQVCAGRDGRVLKAPRPHDRVDGGRPENRRTERGSHASD